MYQWKLDIGQEINLKDWFCRLLVISTFFFSHAIFQRKWAGELQWIYFAGGDRDFREVRRHVGLLRQCPFRRRKQRAGTEESGLQASRFSENFWSPKRVGTFPAANIPLCGKWCIPVSFAIIIFNNETSEMVTKFLRWKTFQRLVWNLFGIRRFCKYDFLSENLSFYYDACSLKITY